MRKCGGAAVWIVLISSAAAGGEWHEGLYLGNDGWWRQRVAVTVRNEMQRDAVGEPVSFRIGAGEGEAALAGAEAGAVRVCDAAGVEMLFRITDPQGREIRTGAIPRGSTLTIPAECPAGKEATYYVYFDNARAWAPAEMLDAHIGVTNGSMEAGEGGTPAGWVHDAPDAEHRASWVDEQPHSGKRCLKTVVAEGAEPSWTGTRQRGIHIVGGARYRLEAWVKAEGVQGSAGWYIHVGHAGNSMLLNRHPGGGAGTYGWKKVSVDFTAPAEATVASMGTLLRGTGMAWFDDVSLTCVGEGKFRAVASGPERLDVREIGGDAEWRFGKDGVRWDSRAAIRVVNASDEPSGSVLVHADIGAAVARLRGAGERASLCVVDERKVLSHYRLGRAILFAATVPPRSIRTYYVYLSPEVPKVDPKHSLHPAPIPVGGWAIENLVQAKCNLVKNASFEEGSPLPADWTGGAPAEKGTSLESVPGGRFGQRCVRMHLPHGGQTTWTGWRQDVNVKPGRSYLYAAWVKCEDLRGDVKLHGHCRTAAGKMCDTHAYSSVGTGISGTTDWTLMSGMLRMPPDVARFHIHLTTQATGTVWHDGVVFAEVVPGSTGRLEGLPQPRESVAVWPVNPIVKVFREDVPPREPRPAAISLARNEKEPLQLVIRGGRAVKGVRVDVDAPTNAAGEKLPDVTVGVVGYVPIDHVTSYYRSTSPTWHRKFPTGRGGSDGWAGMWPDPILPRQTFDLAGGASQPVWITFGAPKTAAPGEYKGTVRFVAAGTTLKDIPFTVRVRSFSLPDESHVKAVYDVRFSKRWEPPGKSDEQTRRELWRFLAERRCSPHRIWPDPVIRYGDGKVTADFTKFDEAAAYYFDVLKLPHAYTPRVFYLFGWGHPPGKKFGVAPYEGEYPYEGVDRGKLNPAYKRAYQACLKVFWEHVRAKGWADRFTLYISDEPHFRDPGILPQMQALCEMIREVDPSIPIYSSTWSHVPEWDGSLSVWGIAHYGRVPVKKMDELRKGRATVWFTTDGQMCTDTPYCGVERLLPHYCFKYGAKAYEFWGVSWLTYNPYEFGWHAYINQSSKPGVRFWVRYPNGDGFLLYPGGPVGHDGPVTSIRMEQAREGVEDYEYLYLLRQRITAGRTAGTDVSGAEQAMAAARALVEIPNAGGRYSTKFLPNPDGVFDVREKLAEAIEALTP